MKFTKEMGENQPDRNHVLSGGHQQDRQRPLRSRAVVATASTVLATGWLASPMGGLTAQANTTLPSTDAPPVVNGVVQVSTASQLEYMDQNQSSYLSSNIDLMNNIDLSGYSWVPFSTGTDPYSGTFNGHGYTVTNLNVNSSAEFTGFFGGTSGTIENLNIQGSVTSTGAQTGGLVGYQYGGVITHCSTSVSVTGNGVTGGLVGDQAGNITSSYATGSVFDASDKAYIGGLVGSEGNGSVPSSISNSYATGLVTGYEAWMGGLVGEEMTGSSISNSYETGSVINAGSHNGYLTVSMIGGLVSLQDGSITNSYATGVMGSGGGLVYASTGGVPSNSFFDTTTTGQWAYNGSVATGAESNTQMQVQSTFSNAGWDFTSTWAIAPNKNGGYPYLQSLGPAADAPTLSASLGVAAGALGGTTTVSATANTSGDTLYYLVSTSQQAIPLQGFGAYSTITQAPTNGTNLPAVANDYVGVYEVNSSNHIVAFSQIQLASGDIAIGAPTLGTTPTAAPGSLGGTTTVTATPNTSGDTLVYQVSMSAIATPAPNSTPPSGAGVFTSGTNLSAAAGDTVGVYEVNSSKQVVAFSSLTLTSGDISTTLGTTLTAVPGSSVGTTTVIATPNTSGDTLVYQVSTSAIATPVLNSAPPSGSGVFASGANLSAVAGDTVGVYEVNSSKQVVAFSSITLTSGDIATTLGTTPAAPPVGSNGEVQVSTTGELEYIDQNQGAYLSKTIDLLSNIDLTGYSWVPLGSASTPFTGTFNGGGHAVTGLNISGSGDVGFLGDLQGTVENLGVQSTVQGAGGNYPGVGGLVGQMLGGTILNSHTSGSVSGSYVEGGLVGLQDNGEIIDSHSADSVSGNGMSGGLVGFQQSGNIADSYATGPISGSDGGGGNGGLVGYQNNQGIITNSYATGPASGASASSNFTNGGLVGWDYLGTNTGGYYLSGPSIYSSNIEGITGTGLTATQMSQQSSFAGWDFTSKTASWAIDSTGSVNNGYPYWAAIITSSLPSAMEGSNYQFTMMAFDRAGVRSWSATGLPTGITMDSSTGVLSGAPLKSGNYSVTVTMQDTAGNTRTTSLSLEVVAYAPTLGTTPTAAPGSSVGTTTITATSNTTGDKLVYQVSTSAIATPVLNSAPPSGSGVFASGTNLSAATGDTVGVYEVNSSKQVVAFSSLTLTKSDILGATITYDGNGATGIAPTDSNQYMVGASPTVAGQGSLTKTGYTFVGWNTKADGSGTSYAPGASLTMPASNVTLYAQWTINNYSLSYNGNGNTSGSVPSGSSPSYNTTITVPGNTGNLTKTGYTFTGWNTKADGTGTDYAPGASLIMPASKVTLYAQWFLNPTVLQHTKVTSTGWSESWIPVSGVSSYDIYLDGSKVATVTQATYDFTGKQPDTTYAVTIASVNGSGQVSAQSKPDLVTTLYNATGVPTGLQHSDVTTTGWKETWTPATGKTVGTVTYDVYLDGKYVGATPSTFYNFTGLSSGTTYSVTIASVNGSGQVSGQSLSDQVTTGVPLSVGTTWAWNGQYGVPFNTLQLEAVSGDGPYTWSVIQGALPLGLKLSSDGVISGTPTGPSVGSTFTVQVTDASGQKASKALSIQVWGAPPLTIQTTSLPKGKMGQSYSAQLLADGGKPFQWSLVSETLPTGVSLSPAGLLSGVPTESGSFPLTVQVSDEAGSPVQKSLQLTIQPLPSGEGLFNFNGHIQTIPVLMNHGIPYLAIWYLMQELNTVDIQSHWLGQDWYLSTATQPYLYFLQPGSGTTSIYLNGVLVQNVTLQSAVDPSTHKLTAFMPLWSLTGILHRIGYQTSWDGTMWTVTK